MTDWVTWFRGRLRSSGEDFMWAFGQIPAVRYKIRPPDPDFFGSWEPARLVWHVTEYERCVVIPTMKHWLGDPPLLDDDGVWPDNDAAWAAKSDELDDYYGRAFWDVRNQQIALLDSLTTVNWSQRHPTVWGAKPLSMVVTKTFQHTLEHGNTLLRMALWWGDVAEAEEEVEEQG